MRDLLEDIASFVAVSLFTATFYLWAAYLAEKV